MLKQFIKQFSKEEIVKDFVKIERSYFSVNEQIKQTISLIQTKPAFAGIPLGTESSIFKPSLFLLQKICKLSDKKIIVDKKGEWMFICGKDIFGKSITKFAENLKQGELVLVENQHGECLGYGKIIAELNNKGNVLENIFDIGDFLRRER